MNLDLVLQSIPPEGATMTDLTGILGPLQTKIRPLLAQGKARGLIRAEGKASATRYFHIQRGAPVSAQEDLVQASDPMIEETPAAETPAAETPAGNTTENWALPGLAVRSLVEDQINPATHRFSHRTPDKAEVIHHYVLSRYPLLCPSSKPLFAQAKDLAGAWTMLQMADALADLAQWGYIIVRKVGRDHLFGELAPMPLHLTIPSLALGDTEVWYANSRRYLKDGYESCKEDGLLPDPADLGVTHTLLGRVFSKDPHEILRDLQGEVWNPSKEGREIIKERGVSHTGMSVGDILVIDGKVLFLDRHDFVEMVEETT